MLSSLQCYQLRRIIAHTTGIASVARGGTHPGTGSLLTINEDILPFSLKTLCLSRTSARKVNYSIISEDTRTIYGTICNDKTVGKSA
jgi:hypothetical protein